MEMLLSDLSDTYYLAIDPGKTTGWAAYTKEGVLIQLGKIKGEDKFLDWLETQSPHEAIVEVYRNRPGWHNSWSTGPTQQHIGAIKRTLRKKGLTTRQIHDQEPSPCLDIGCKWAGIPNTKGKHLDDAFAAHAHGTYYLISNGIQRHRLDRTDGKK